MPMSTGTDSQLIGIETLNTCAEGMLFYIKIHYNVSSSQILSNYILAQRCYTLITTEILNWINTPFPAGPGTDAPGTDTGDGTTDAPSDSSIITSSIATVLMIVVAFIVDNAF